MTDDKQDTNNRGRPRSFDRKQVGLNFIEFVKANPDCYTVPQFATTIGLSSDTMLTWCKEDEDFRRSYIIAKELIGINRLKAATTRNEVGQFVLDKAIYLKGEGNYNRDIRDYEREETAFEYGLKKDDAKSQVHEESSKKLDVLVEILRDTHSDKSKCKIADSNNISDSKS